MAGNQTDNLLLLDLTTGLARTNETGGTPDTIQLSTDFQLISGANMLIDGDLTVNGTTTTIHSEQVNIRDNHLYLNADYTTTSAQTGGLVVNVLPTATADTIAGTFVAGVAAVSNPTVQTTGTGTFSAGDVIQIAGANEQGNDGIFEVLSHVGTTLTIRGVGITGATVPWVVTDFVADTTAGGDVRVVNVNVLEGDSSGNWQTATVTTTTGITYNTFTTQGVVDLQEAYEQGNTITTSAPEGDITFAGTETFVITTSGGVNLDAPFDFDSTTFDVQMTGSNGFSIDGTAASNVTVDAGDLTLSTTTSGNLVASSAGTVDVDATTSITVDTADAADASGNDITVTAGSSTSGTNGGASIILTPGDGNTTGVAGFVHVDSPADEDEILLQIESGGSGANAVGFFTGTSAPGGSVTADAGSLFLRDTGSGAEAYINTSTGSGTTWTQLAAGGGNSLQAAYGVGNTIVTNSTDGDLDVSGTEAISLDASAASNFTVAGANLDLGTTTSGDVNISSAAQVDIDGGTTVVIDTADATDASGNDITVTAGSSTGGANGGASVILTPGDGDGAGAAGAVEITGPNDEDESLVTLTTSGTNGDSVNLFVGDSDPDTAVTGLAGSLFFRDTGTTGELYLNTSTGSGTSWQQVVTSGAGGGLTLQTAYEGGNTIVTDTTNGDFDVSGTEAISLDASSASNFTVAGANLDLSTTTSGDVNVSAAGEVDIDGGTTVVIDTADAADASGNDITVTAGSSTAGTNAGASIILTPGDGNTTGAAGSVDITGPNDEDEALVTLTTSGTNGDSVEMFVGDSDPSGSVTGLAGSLFFRDTGSGAELYLNTSTGSGTTWTALSTGGSVTLQNAYVNGNTITTSGGEGDITFAGTEDFVVTLSDLLVDTTASISLDADSASNFTVDGGNLTLSTTTSGEVLVDGVDGVEINSSGGAIDIGNDANAQAINVGTGAAARTITVGNSTGATGVVVNVGTGEFALNSTVGEADPVATLTTTGTNGDSVEMFVGDSDPSGAVTGLAGSLFMRDTSTSGELYINTSTGSGTAWTQVATEGSVTLQDAYEAGNTIVTDTTNGDFDVSGTEAISLDASAASNFSVAGANLTLETTTSGTIDINSAADIDITFATANATAMVIDDGSNTYMTFDSTVAEPAVEVSEFLDIVGSGAGVTLTAGEAISAADVVTIEATSGDAILADSNTGTTLDGLAIGVAAFAAADTAPVKVYTVPGSLVPINFGSAPAAASNGSPVFVSNTPGEVTLTAPTGSGNVVYVVGILQGADGADTSPLVLYQPQFIAVRP